MYVLVAPSGIDLVDVLGPLELEAVAHLVRSSGDVWSSLEFGTSKDIRRGHYRK